MYVDVEVKNSYNNMLHFATPNQFFLAYIPQWKGLSVLYHTFRYTPFTGFPAMQCYFFIFQFIVFFFTNHWVLNITLLISALYMNSFFLYAFLYFAYSLICNRLKNKYLNSNFPLFIKNKNLFLNFFFYFVLTFFFFFSHFF